MSTPLRTLLGDGPETRRLERKLQRFMDRFGTHWQVDERIVEHVVNVEHTIDVLQEELHALFAALDEDQHVSTERFVYGRRMGSLWRAPLLENGNTGDWHEVLAPNPGEME